jgi:thymidylate synthase ThyX
MADSMIARGSRPRSGCGSDYPFTEPEVRLVNAFDRPLDNAVAAARTCYSARGVITPEQVAGEGLDPAGRAERASRRNALARDLYKAGHHTTFQHVHLQYALDRVSRQFIWSFLHAHPFYNSEQVSQRYVEVKPESFYVPPLPDSVKSRYLDVARRQIEDYRRLTELLVPLVAAEFYRIFPARARQPERWRKAIEKRAIEVARYVLPVATLSRLYHTISAITLLRYHRLAAQLDAPFEQQQVVSRMVEELLRVDPDYAEVMEEPLPLEETVEHRFYTAHHTPTEGDHRALVEEFDSELGELTSRLVARKTDNEALLARSVREVLGVPRGRLDDDAAITLVLDPAANRYLGESLNLTSISKLARCLVHPSYTFIKKLSHAADSQDQRHRATPASRPCLPAYLGENPDAVIPVLVRADQEVRRVYEESLAATWEGIGEVRRLGAPDEFAAYLLPNAVALRFTESADLSALRHKLEMRLCYNAQEEIWQASVDEALQISAEEPRIGRHLLPPCTVRLEAGARPICPEGKRFCGVRVWDLPVSDYRRLI